MSRLPPWVLSVPVAASLFLTVCVVATAGAMATPLAAGSSNPVWAYGTVKTIELSGTDGAGHMYEGAATFGFSVILNETRNTTTGAGTIYTVNVVRTMGALINVSFCPRSCASSAHVANYSYHAWEKVDAWANLTPNGTVTEPSPNGTVPALALLNSSLTVTAKLRESAAYVVGGQVRREGSLAVNVSGQVTVNLSTPLGLFPLSFGPGTTWNSTAAYSAAGSVAWSDHYTYWGKNVTAVLNGSNSGSDALSHNGSITILGNYADPSPVVFGGRSYPDVNLTVQGPFALREGVILVPVSADLFGSGSHPWSGSQDGSANVTTARVDIRPGGSNQGHLPIVASSAVWASSTADSAAALVPDAAAAVPAVAAPAAALPGSGSNGTLVQGQPESVAQAQADQNCLVTGVGCPTSAPGVPWARYVLLGGVGAVVVALLSVGLIARRKQPAPVYPNARLYPPGQGSPGAATPRPAPKPTEDDPLGHLW